MKQVPLIYVACPYFHKSQDVMSARFEAVNAFCAELMREGLLIFSPISHTHPIAQYGLPKGWDFWKAYDQVYLDMCAGAIVLRLGGWENSTGVAAEIAEMNLQRKPVVYANSNDAMLAVKLIRQAMANTPRRPVVLRKEDLTTPDESLD